jgi:regulator of cell morphogenesis and NO signaling
VAIFKKYGLDFCCGGKRTVKEACAEKGLDSTRIEQELQQADKVTETRPVSFQDWPLHFLADYIVNVHHSYVRKTLPELLGYAAKVSKVHGKSHPELPPIYQLIVEINNELVEHLEEEESVLFPAVKAMSLSGSVPDSLELMLNSMQDDHTQVGKKLAIIQQLSNGYSIPEDACSSYSILYRMLSDFQADLELHIHLENNVLCPKALSQLKS